MKNTDFADLEFKEGRPVLEYHFTETGPSTKGVFEGYASVFNREDDGGDLIIPGAFKQTLSEYDKAGDMPKMLLNHGGMGGFLSSPAPEDLLPIGKWSSMSEDSHGLQAKGRLINLDTESGKRIYGAMKENALSGLSIGYRAKDFVRGTKENEPRRTLKQVHLVEVSPVTFPMQGAASISSVKSFDFSDPRTAEKLLRDVGGFTGSQAREFVSRVKALGLRDVGPDKEAQDVIAAIKRRMALFRA